MTELDGLEELLLGDLLGAALDHHHGIGRAGHDHVERARFELGLRRVDDRLSIDEADAHAGDIVIERDIGHGERRTCADERHDVRIDLGIDREDRDDDMDVVTETFGEERPDRTIDDARGERRLLGRTALALDETARDLSGGVHALFIVDGEGEELDALAGVGTCGNGGEHAGVAVPYEDGAVGLACELACFKRELPPAQLHADGLWQGGSSTFSDGPQGPSLH